MSEEWSCSSPGIDELMMVFEAAVGPYLDPIKIAIDPDHPDIDATLAAEIVLDLGSGLVSIPALALIDVLEVVGNLPPLPAPFDVGTPELEGWDIEVQGVALADLITSLLALPLDIALGIFGGSITVPPEFPDVIEEMLPDIPGIEGLANCISEIMEPVLVPP